MEAVNESAKNVAKSHELIKKFIDTDGADGNEILLSALDLLEKTLESLTKTQ